MNHTLEISPSTKYSVPIEVGDVVKFKGWSQYYMIVCVGTGMHTGINLTNGGYFTELITLESLSNRVEEILPKGSKVVITI